MKAIARLGNRAASGKRKGAFTYARMARIAVALATILLTAHAQAAGYSMQITFTNLPGGVTLTNFPALVKLSTNNTDNYTGFLDTTDGWDLRFWTNSALEGELDYEIEAFDTSTNSYVWVKVPELTQDTSIWASWGDSTDQDQKPYTTNGNVWSEGFEGVFHLSESVTDEQTSGSYDDSSPNDNAGAQNNTGVGDGLIGSCGDFDGNDYIIVANESDYDFKDKITAAMWIRTAGGWDKSWQMFMTKGADKHWDLRRYSNTEQVEFITDNDNPGCVGPATNIANDEWRYFVGVYDQADGKGRAYIDGQLYHVDTSADTDLTLNNEPLQISGRQGANFCHKGLIDEVRVSNAVRSSNWVWACWMNQGANHDSFVEYGTVSAPIGVVVDITNGNATVAVTTYDIGGTNDATVVGTMSWTNALTGSNGTFTATSPWTVSGIDLAVGANVITVSGTNSAGDVGNDSVTIVRAGPPSVDNAGGATGIDIGVATLQGRVTATNGASLGTVRIYFGDNDGGETHNWDTNFVFSSVSEGVAFSNSVSNLYYGLEYSYRVYASNEYGEVWSAVTNFTTLEPVAVSLGTPGLLSGTLSGGSIDTTTPNPLNGDGVAVTNLGPRRAQTQDWGGDTTYVYTGQMYFDGTDYFFIESIDDGVWLNIDGTVYINNTSWSDVSNSGLISKPEGWYDFELRLGNVGGGKGYVNRNPGFQYHNGGGTSDAEEDNWYPEDPGDASLFRIGEPPVPPSLVNISNTEATNIAATTVDLLGTLDATQSVFTVTAYWSTSNNTGSAEWLADGTASNAFVATYTNVVGQSLSNHVENLDSGTTYYYTFMASNAVTNIWASPTESFTTLAPPAVNNSTGATAVTETSATIRGELTAGIAASAWICWGANDGGRGSTGDWENVLSMGTVVQGDEFSTNFTGLATNQGYWYRCYVRNAVGTGWSEVPTSFSGTPVDGGVGDAIVGINFAKSGGSTMSITDSAGVIAVQTNWNNTDGSLSGTEANILGPTSAKLVDSSGSETSLTISWAFPTDYSNDNDGNGDEKMMDDYLDNTGGERTISVSGIDALEFHVYAYFGSGANDRTGKIGIDGSDTYSFNTHSQTKAFPAEYLQTTDTETTYPDANYAVWSNLTGTAFTLRHTRVAGNSGIHGIQIVISNPTSIANRAPTAITANQANLNATLISESTTNTVYVHWGVTDGGTNIGSWAGYAEVGSWTNVASTNISYLKTGLSGSTTNWYTFRASNDTEEVWAKPSWMFVTEPDSGGGSVFRFK